MGGLGSGSWWRWSRRTTVEETLSLDIREVARRGLLAPGTTFSWRWARGGEPAGSVSVLVRADRLSLRYQVRRDEGEPWRQVEQPVALDHTACPFGGRRPWFLCPHCGRRVARLHLVGRTFACRHCHQLAYASQSEGWGDRATRRARKAWRRLGADDGEAVVEKPKGMHQRTFDRLLGRAYTAEEEADAALALAMARMLGTGLEGLLQPRSRAGCPSRQAERPVCKGKQPQDRTKRSGTRAPSDSPG